MKILIADDDPGSLRVLCRAVERWGHEPIACSDGNQAWTGLHTQDAPRLAILDWMMPGIDGVEICKQLRQRDAESYVYTILLTARAGQRHLTEGMTAGADDYIVKPFDHEELEARIGSGVRILSLHQELAEMRRILEQQAKHDALTGVFNRRAFFEQIDQEWGRAVRYANPLTCVLLDLDHFKQLNDTYGHLVGDAALVRVGEILQRHTRTHDFVCRYGGEEFCVLLPHTSEAQASQWADRVRGEIAAICIPTEKGNVAVTASFGVAQRDEDLSTANQLIDAADRALFAAKEHGRNTVRCYYSPDGSVPRSTLP